MYVVLGGAAKDNLTILDRIFKSKPNFLGQSQALLLPILCALIKTSFQRAADGKDRGYYDRVMAIEGLVKMVNERKIRIPEPPEEEETKTDETDP